MGVEQQMEQTIEDAGAEGGILAGLVSTLTSTEVPHMPTPELVQMKMANRKIDAKSRPVPVAVLRIGGQLVEVQLRKRSHVV